MYFETGVPSSDFELRTTGDNKYGVGCVNGKLPVGDKRPTCTLCVTAQNGTDRQTLACARDVTLLAQTLYRVTMRIPSLPAPSVDGLLYNQYGTLLANISFPLTAGLSVKGNVQISHPYGPGYLCVRRIMAYNQVTCPNQTSALVSSATVRCTQCSELSNTITDNAQNCACSGNNMTPSNGSCGGFQSVTLDCLSAMCHCECVMCVLCVCVVCVCCVCVVCGVCVCVCVCVYTVHFKTNCAVNYTAFSIPSHDSVSTWSIFECQWQRVCHLQCRILLHKQRNHTMPSQFLLPCAIVCPLSLPRWHLFRRRSRLVPELDDMCDRPLRKYSPDQHKR